MPLTMLFGIQWRKLEKLFILGSLISCILNIALISYLTKHHLNISNPSPILEDGPTVVTNSDNAGHPFSIVNYRHNDIVSDSIQKWSGWELEKVSSLTRLYTEYSAEHNISLSELTFVDIGANVGWYTMSMAALGVRVVAIEPMEANLELMRRSLKIAKNVESGVSDRVTLVEYGVGCPDSGVETCWIYSDNGNFGDGHVGCVEREADLNMEEGYAVRGRVQLKRLDDIIDTRNMNVLAVKMDTEGYEWQALEGGTTVLLDSGLQAILSEFQPETMMKKGGDPVKFMTKIVNAGYLAKKDAYGYEYWSREEMLDIKNFNDEMLTLHSETQVQKTIEQGKKRERENEEMEKQEGFLDDTMNRYYENVDNQLDRFDSYYDANSTNPTVKCFNEGTEFAIDVYKENDIVSKQINSYARWESDQIKSLNELFKEYSKEMDIPLSDLTFMDIGANIGWLTLNIAALGVKVLAFEPMTENIKLLKKTLAKKINIDSGVTSRITLYEHGLGASTETCFLYSDDTNVGDGHVQCVKDESELTIPNNYTVREQISVKRLDDVVDIKGMNIVAIKLDTEGYEANILEGGTKLFLSGDVAAIITEFVPDWVTEKGGNPVEFIKKLRDAGYRARRGGGEWGYMKKKEMMNMTNFGLEKDVIFHSDRFVSALLGGSD